MASGLTVTSEVAVGETRNALLKLSPATYSFLFDLAGGTLTTRLLAKYGFLDPYLLLAKELSRHRFQLWVQQMLK